MPSLTTIGDEPLEARIVAWVLGDASAFEEAELERLCAERPELLVFRRRMRALHGLLTEAEAAQPDPTWKLPPEKRKVLDELFGAPVRLTNKPTPARKRRSTWNWTISALAACLIALLVIGAMFSMKGIGDSGKCITSLGKADQKREYSAPVARYSLSAEPQVAAAGEKRHRSLEESEPENLLSPKPASVRAPAKPSAPTSAMEPGTSDFYAQRRTGLRPSAESSPPASGRDWEVLARADSAAETSPAPPAAVPLGGDSRVAGDAIAKAETPAPPAGPASGDRNGFGGGWAETLAIPGQRPITGQPVAGKPATAPPSDIAAKVPSTHDLPVNGNVIAGGLITGASDQNQPVPPGEPHFDMVDALTNQKPAASENLETTYGFSVTRSDSDRFSPTVPPSLSTSRFQTTAPETQSDFGRTAQRGTAELPQSTATVADAKTATITGTTIAGGGALGLDGTTTLNLEAASKQAESSPQLPSLSNRLSWHSQNEGTKGNANLSDSSAIVPEGAAMLTETTSGGLRADLSKSLAEREIVRRQESVVEADRLLRDGRKAQEEGRLAEADSLLRIADEKLPDAPLLAEKKKEIAGRRDAVTKELGDKTWEMSLPPDAADLAKSVAEQEDRVEESRKQLAQIVRTKGIVYYGQDSLYRNAGMEDEHGARAAQDTYIALETERTQLDGAIKAMLKHDGDSLLSYASGLDLPENAVRTLYPRYNQAKAQLEAFKQEGHGEQDPGYQAKKQELDTMRKQLDAGTVDLRDTLQAKLDLANGRWERAKAALTEKKMDSIKGSMDRQDFEEAKKVFESESEKLAALKANLAAVAPKPPPPVPADELSAESEPYSTFSLSVSDASFKTAHAALMQNNTPDPAGIRVEQFYNAMDYGDPYPTKGEPVAAAIEQAAHPVIPARNLVRVALRTAAEGRAASQPLCLTLLVDQSGSMARDDRRQALARALSELATLLTPADRVTVIGFSLTSHMLADRLPGNEAAKLADLVNLDASEGGTNLESALVLGKEVAEARKIPGAQNRIVLFTDGAANLGNADPAKLALTIQQARQSGLSFDVAGLGTSELNDRLLAELARHGNGRFHVVDAAADAPDSFAKQLAGAFRPAAENVKVQVRFNPSRVGGYKLLGFEEHRLNREDFHNDAVDAAELAAAEAGVALYQIETLPGGSGDIGEVSVRFRDTATGSMVERSWNIAYDPNAPAFDRATPSLQLAGVAMLAAEKLRGGPLAAATDFTTLATPLTTIRQTFPNSPRAAELLEMVGKLR